MVGVPCAKSCDGRFLPPRPNLGNDAINADGKHVYQAKFRMATSMGKASGRISYRWVAQPCLLLLSSGSGPSEIYVEGDENTREGDESIDEVEMYSDGRI